MRLDAATTFAVENATETLSSESSLPGAITSILIGVFSAVVTGFMQQLNTKRVIKNENMKRADEVLDKKLAALRAYAGGLQDAMASEEAKESGALGTGIQFPKNLDQLRIEARPYYAHVEKEDQQAYWRMTDPVADYHPMDGSMAKRFEGARQEVLKVIGALEEKYSPRGR